MDRINISFDTGAKDAAQAADVAPFAVEPEPAVALVPEPAAAAENVADQLAALLTQSPDVDVRRASGFSIDTLELARDASLDGVPVSAPVVAAIAQPADTAIGGDFFATAQANLARDRQCIDDLTDLAAQARVYFPSGALNGEQSGLEQARVLGMLAQQCQGISIRVEGHSDASGDPVINQRLSLERADTVVSRVAAMGIDRALFDAVGLGSAQPSGVRGAQPDAYYDRRVEFSVVEVAQSAAFVAPTFGAAMWPEMRPVWPS